MIIKQIHDDSWSKSSRRIHTASGVLYGEEVAEGDGEPDGEGRRPVQVSPVLVAHGEHRQDEHEGACVRI